MGRAREAHWREEPPWNENAREKEREGGTNQN